jgi:hypothetical protein
MKKAQEQLSSGLSGFSMLTQLTRITEHQLKRIEKHNLWASDSLIKSLSIQARIVIPQETIDAIDSINRKHEKLFIGLNSISESLKIQTHGLTQIKNLNFALSGISGQVAAAAALQRNWKIINEFEEVTEKAIGFSEAITKEVTEEQKRQFQILLALISQFAKKYGVHGLLITDIVLRFAGLHQYYDFLQKKPELSTKQEVNHIVFKQDSIIQFLFAVNEQLKIANEYRTTNRECDVKLKPKKKSFTVSRLPIKFELVVLQVNNKWLLVSFFDPKDNLPQTGWIMKKYLDKPE